MVPNLASLAVIAVVAAANKSTAQVFPEHIHGVYGVGGTCTDGVLVKVSSTGARISSAKDEIALPDWTFCPECIIGTAGDDGQLWAYPKLGTERPPVFMFNAAQAIGTLEIEYHGMTVLDPALGAAVAASPFEKCR